MDWQIAKSIGALIAGAIVVWLVYREGYREFAAKGDDYAAGVTLMAMTGTFLPFVGLAATRLSP